MYVIKGRRKDGADAYLASEETGHSFVDETMDAAFVGGARSAKALLGAVSRMGTYHRGSSMDLSSFAVHRADIEAKPVAIDDAVRAKLADADAKVPQGLALRPHGRRGPVRDAIEALVSFDGRPVRERATSGAPVGCDVPRRSG